MSTETLQNNLNKDIPINKVNVEVLKNRIIKRKKKEKFQIRIILGSLAISIGVIGYFVS
tara:strand:+ start:72 stop:248 length:177 start_codon:yes stop_codon:yes gene_type:complete